MRLTVRDLQQIHPLEIRHRQLLKGSLGGVSTDSRTTIAGELFVALKGPAFDGHRFLGDALARGARALMVEETMIHDGMPEVPLVVVEDTTRALGELARVYRSKFDIPVLGIGGSSGKTTTKDMIAAVLGTQYRVLSTEKNYNNHIGVPKTLFGLERKHDIAVVEMGTNHPGELRILCDILQPTHGLLTNIGAEHLEFFLSLDGVEEEEGVLFDFLARRRGGVGFLNADDVRVMARARGLSKRLTYGFSARRTDIRGRRMTFSPDACARFHVAGHRLRRPLAVSLGVPGRHHALNALAAAAVGVAFGVPGPTIQRALEKFRGSDKRMAVIEAGGVRILNDTYNANPDSTIAALETLAAITVSGKRIAVLGDMLELGGQEAAEHRRVGLAAGQLRIDHLLTYGERARTISESSRLPGALHYDQKNVLAEYLAELVGPGDAVLLKGSRGMAMEDVVTFLVQVLAERSERDGKPQPE
jgi:UDP-N-acetylmuramoyl-tripeptide--D-alanyl-D-alanine ligase